MCFLLANNCNALRHTLPCKSHSPVTGVWLFHITSNPLARIFHIWSHLFSFSWSAWSVTPGLRSASSSSSSAQVSACHTRQKIEPPNCIIPSSILSASQMSPALALPQGLLRDDISVLLVISFQLDRNLLQLLWVFWPQWRLRWREMRPGVRSLLRDQVQSEIFGVKCCLCSAGSPGAAPRSHRTQPISRTRASPPPTPTPPPASTPSSKLAPTSASSGWTLSTSWPRALMSTPLPSLSALMTRWGEGGKRKYITESGWDDRRWSSPHPQPLLRPPSVDTTLVTTSTLTHQEDPWQPIQL